MNELQRFGAEGALVRQARAINDLLPTSMVHQ